MRKEPFVELPSLGLSWVILRVNRIDGVNREQGVRSEDAEEFYG